MALQRLVQDEAFHACWILTKGRVLQNRVGNDSSYVRGGHTGAVKNVDHIVAGVPGRDDLLAWGVDIVASASVGE